MTTTDIRLIEPTKGKIRQERRQDPTVAYLDRWMSPLKHDIDHNDVIDTPRLLHILAHVIC